MKKIQRGIIVFGLLLCGMYFGDIDSKAAENPTYTIKKGKADGELIGGNLSLISRMSAGKYKVNFKNKIQVTKKDN